jgi:hypothetical protein
LPDSPPDRPLVALQELDGALAFAIDELVAARAQICVDVAKRGDGMSWRTIAEGESRPLVVERLTLVLDRLSASGSRFRRAEAEALHGDGLSMERVAALFGVTRQRVSALLRERAPHR